jgi:hypothetical protein
MTKPHASTVIDGDNDSTVEVERLLTQLELAEEEDNIAAAKTLPLTVSSTINYYASKAARRDAVNSARAKARSVDTTRTATTFPNFFSTVGERVSATLRNLGSPLSGDGKEATKHHHR